MRLIDGNIQAMFITNFILERKEKIIDILQKRDNDYLFALMMNYFDEQPTAYSVGKIVNELEEIKDKYDHSCIDNAYQRGVQDGAKWMKKKAIEIVKQGDLDEVIEIVKEV